MTPPTRFRRNDLTRRCGFFGNALVLLLEGGIGGRLVVFSFDCGGDVGSCSCVCEQGSSLSLVHRSAESDLARRCLTLKLISVIGGGSMVVRDLYRC
jgi:hypothetical protein